MPDLPTFFYRRYPANSGANPPAVSPRVSAGISFRAQGHFVSDFSREKIDQWSQCVAGHENLKRNEMQKKRHAEVCKCGGSHPHAPPPGRTRHFRTPGGVPGGSEHAVGKAFHSLPAARRSLFRGKGWAEPPKSPGGPELYGRADQIATRKHRCNNRAKAPDYWWYWARADHWCRAARTGEADCFVMIDLLQKRTTSCT